jgi:ubiquinone/menaquinone biosynthesis C-methylase UbiE
MSGVVIAAPAAALAFALAFTLAFTPSSAVAQAVPGAAAATAVPARDAQLEKWRSTLEYEGREVYDRRKDVLTAIELRPGMSVADLGAGTGLFTRMFAPLVKPGKVFAIDVSEKSVSYIRSDASEQGLDNVVALLGTDTDTRLAEGSVDLVFVSDTYHHFEQPQAMLASIRRALKPGGRLALLDFERIPGVSPDWILKHVRAGKETFTKEIESAGFRLQEEKKFLRENYFLMFVRD